LFALEANSVGDVRVRSPNNGEQSSLKFVVRQKSSPPLMSQHCPFRVPTMPDANRASALVLNAFWRALGSSEPEIPRAWAKVRQVSSVTVLTLLGICGEACAVCPDSAIAAVIAFSAMVAAFVSFAIFAGLGVARALFWLE
jgi:hypothetical protein